MKKTIIWILSVIGCGAVMSLVFNMFDGKREIKTVSVTGECITNAPRDKAAITLRVETLDKNPAKSVNQATTLIRQINESVKQMPVEIQTTQFSSYEKTEWDNDAHKSISLGTETNISVEISANSVDTIEEIMSQFAGTPNVYSENLRIYTSATQTQAAIETCMAGALDNARARAENLAKSDGHKLGKLLHVSYGANSSNNSGAPRVMNKMMVASMADASGTIVAKDSEIGVNISATFEIK